MVDLVLQTLWFFLPAMTANMAPVLVSHSRFLLSLAYPLDGGYTWQGKRLLGHHKTLSGLVLGLLVGGSTGWLQHLAYGSSALQSISLISYASVFVSIYIGILLGAGALLGDAVKSFFKRRLDIAPGQPWIPLDQIDLVLGAIAVTWWIDAMTIAHDVAALIIIGIGSYIVSAIGVKTHIKKSL